MTLCCYSFAAVVLGMGLGQIKEPAGPLSPFGYVCYRASGQIGVDGDLGDDAWMGAPWTAEFVDIEGAAKPKPRFRTRVKMLWDDNCLYVGAEIEEPHVWATLTERDSVIFHDNDFEVFLDPDGDNHLYAEIEVNALGTVWDLLLVKPYRDGGPAVNGWDVAGLKVGVRVNGTLNDPSDTDRGWSVEIAIPWKALAEVAGRPCPPRHGDQWRINFSRVQWETRIEGGRYEKVPNKPEDNWVWSPQGVIDMHRPERWGYLQFSTMAPGSDVFRSDPGLPIREALHKVYYAQRAYREKHGRFAESLQALGSLDLKLPQECSPIRIQATDSGFEASVSWKAPDGKPIACRIRGDSRYWEEPDPGS